MRVFLTVSERNELRKHATNNAPMSHVDLQAWAQRTFGKSIGRSTVGKIINSDIEMSLNPAQQKTRTTKYPEMESGLFDFVLRTEDEAALSDELLYLKANKILEQQQPGASVSLSWVQRFKMRHGIKRRKLHGEAGDVDDRDIHQHRIELQELIDQYNPSDVFNLDETGLFFRMRPSQTLATKSLPGRKKDKTRITVALCCNLAGTSQEEPLIINRAKTPRCFKGHDITKVPILFYANQKAWMTKEVFCDWLKNFNLRMHGRSVLLLVDNASSHVDLSLSNVRVHFLPPNTTSKLQPLDAGIIKSFKAQYRRCFLSWVLAQIDASTGVKHIDLLTCIGYVVEAWKQVTPNTIRNCWAHTGIVSTPTVAKLKQQNEPQRQNLLTDIDDMIARLCLGDAMTAEEYVSFDDNSIVAEDVNDGQDEENNNNNDEEDDDEEQFVYTHREALEAATRLSVYASLHGLGVIEVKKLMSHSRRAMIDAMTQRTIDTYFAGTS